MIKGFGFGDLRTDMTVNPYDIDMFKKHGRFVSANSRLDIHAKLILLETGGNIRVCAGIHIGIDTNSNRCAGLQLLGARIDASQFIQRFYIEHQDTRFESVINFVITLSHTRVHNGIRRKTGLKATVKFTAGNNIKSAAESGK